MNKENRWMQIDELGWIDENGWIIVSIIVDNKPVEYIMATT